MRMQEENVKVTLCVQALLICSLASQLLSTNDRLWLKFLYLIHDKKQSEVADFFKKNADQLVQTCTNSQRLQKVV